MHPNTFPNSTFFLKNDSAKSKSPLNVLASAL